MVGALLFAGDMNSVKVIDPATKQVTKTIVTGNEGVRSDEGCYDATHGIYMISTPEAATPYATFINAVTQAVVATVTFTDATGAPSAGLENCRYDAGTDTFFVNNDGTTANPHGELDALPGAAIRAIAAGATVNYTTLAGARMYAEGNCDPTGLALGPGTDIAIGCREGTTDAPLLVQILNRNTGAVVASLNAGGGDQLEYDSASNRYYNASSRWTASGNASVNGACSTASPCTPVLTIVDAAARTRRRARWSRASRRATTRTRWPWTRVGTGFHADLVGDCTSGMLDVRGERLRECRRRGLQHSLTRERRNSGNAFVGVTMRI